MRPATGGGNTDLAGTRFTALWRTRTFPTISGSVVFSGLLSEEEVKTCSGDVYVCSLKIFRNLIDDSGLGPNGLR